jgi:hypothetical protein
MILSDHLEPQAMVIRVILLEIGQHYHRYASSCLPALQLAAGEVYQQGFPFSCESRARYLGHSGHHTLLESTSEAKNLRTSPQQSSE